MPKRLPHGVLNILIINCLVYVVLHLYPDLRFYFVLNKNNWLGWREAHWISEVKAIRYVKIVEEESTIYYYDTGPQDFRWYQIFTYFWTHFSFWHLFFNGIALFSLGSWVENVMGTWQFIVFYLYSGVLTGLLTSTLDPSPIAVIGASGAVSAVALAFAYYFPEEYLYFFPIPIPIKAWVLLTLYAVFTLIMVFWMPDGGGISHFGHLMGLTSGALWLGIYHIKTKIL